MSDPPAILLGHTSGLSDPARLAGLKAVAETPQFSERQAGQATLLQRCCWCSIALLVATLPTYCCYTWATQANPGNSWTDAKIWVVISLTVTTAFAGWAGLWLWLVAPTLHIVHAGRFLLFNWFGGLYTLLGDSEGRPIILPLELVGLQYLAQDRLNSLWSALSAHRLGACLRLTFWLEIGLVCGGAFFFLSFPMSFPLQLCAASAMLLFLVWVFGVTHTLCRVFFILHRSLRIARQEANLTAMKALLAARRSILLQGFGIIATVSTSVAVAAAAFLAFGSSERTQAYGVVQCINSVVNVAGVFVLSKAYELLRPSAQPPPVSWIRCTRMVCWRPCFQASPSPDEGLGKGSEWEAKTEELASRGISLSDLVGFYSNLGDSIMKSFQPAVHTTNDVVRLGIIPQTSTTCSSYAQLVNDGKKVIPKKMVTHNWSNLFRDLVATVIADALGEHAFEFVAELLCDKHGVKLLQETLRVHGCLEETYWICAFAVNQHAGICGANPNRDIDPVTKIPHPTCACSAPKFFNEDPPLNEHGESIQCEMNKFDDMMAFLSKKDSNFTEVIAVDADLNLFQRSWCIAELAEAHRMGMAQNLMLRNKTTLMNRQCTLEGLQVENMKASRPEDVQQILAKIPDKKAFNKKLQELIFDGTTGLLASWKKADVLQQMEDLSYVLKWARLSEQVEDGALIWRRWIA